MKIYLIYYKYILIDYNLNIFIIFVIEFRFNIYKIKNISLIYFKIFKYNNIILNFINNNFTLIILIDNDIYFFDYILYIINIYNLDKY